MSADHDAAAAVGEVDHIEVDDSAWGGVEENIDDPEEIRVVFCALDSFL